MKTLPKPHIISNMKVYELKAELQKAGLAVSGIKTDLTVRLQREYSRKERIADEGAIYRCESQECGVCGHVVQHTNYVERCDKCNAMNVYSLIMEMEEEVKNRKDD